MYKAIIPILILFFCSCMTTKKMKRISNEYLDNNPSELAIKCAEKFPVKESEIKEGKTDTIYKTKGITEDQIDSIAKEATEVFIGKDKQSYEKGYINGFNIAKEIYKKPTVIRRTDTIKLRDAAYEYVLRDSLNREIKVLNGDIIGLKLDTARINENVREVSKNLKKSRKSNTYKTLIIIALGLIIGSYGVMKVYKLIRNPLI